MDQSIIIFGLPGQGKSSTAAQILAQIVEQGGRLSIIDLHARFSTLLSSFEAAFLSQPARTAERAMATLEQAEEVLHERMQSFLRSNPPFVLVIDKKLLTEGGDVARKLADVVKSFTMIGRKYNCFVLTIG